MWWEQESFAVWAGWTESPQVRQVILRSAVAVGVRRNEKTELAGLRVGLGDVVEGSFTVDEVEVCWVADLCIDGLEVLRLEAVIEAGLVFEADFVLQSPDCVVLRVLIGSVLRRGSPRISDAVRNTLAVEVLRNLSVLTGRWADSFLDAVAACAGRPYTKSLSPSSFLCAGTGFEEFRRWALGVDRDLFVASLRASSVVLLTGRTAVLVTVSPTYFIFLRLSSLLESRYESLAARKASIVAGSVDASSLGAGFLTFRTGLELR